jgi:hypothetical protein
VVEYPHLSCPIPIRKTPFLDAFQHRFYGGSGLPAEEVSDPQAIRRYNRMMRFLISRGASVSRLTFRDYCGWARRHAARFRPEPVRFLLEHGVDPNRDITFGQDPEPVLHYIMRMILDDCYDATSCQRVGETIRLLLEHGANPNGCGSRLITPLHLAVWGTSGRASPGAKRRVTLLLRYGADINAKDTHGMTPLADACRRRPPRESLVRLLLVHGADTSCCRLPSEPLFQKKILRACGEVSKTSGQKFEFAS